MINKTDYQQLLLEWYYKNLRDLPFRKTTDPYAIWISEIMLQQTRVDTVIEYYNRWIKALPTLFDLSQVDDEKLYKLWQGLGYYRRAQNLKFAAQQIVNDFGGKFPNTKKELLKLKGIGEYASGSIASIAFDEKVCAVDGNVLRVISRVDGIKSDILKPDTKKQITNIVENLLPENKVGDFNQALMELGALVCLPNGEPKCDICPLNKICYAKKHNLTSEIPVKNKVKTKKQEELTLFIIRCDDEIVIQKRTDKGLLSNLWQFPNVKNMKDIKETNLYQILLPNIFKINLLNKKKHIFTHIVWDMNAYEIVLSKKVQLPDMIWVTSAQLQNEYSLPTAFHKWLSEIK